MTASFGEAAQRLASLAAGLLGWRPHYDLQRLIDAAFDYQRGADDPRIIWYPG